MRLLPDLNLLLAVCAPNHVHHRVAVDWFDQVADSGWATTAVTELGFVRLVMNPAVMTRQIKAHEAISMLGGLRMVGKHEFWPDSTEASDLDDLAASLQGYRQVPDAHLVKVAEAYEGHVATLDTGVASMAPDRVRLITV